LGVVGEGKLFYFFSIRFICRQKSNVLDRAKGISTMKYNYLESRSAISPNSELHVEITIGLNGIIKFQIQFPIK
jgi:hypothetical protein